jgi:hypothetical protein
MIICKLEIAFITPKMKQKSSTLMSNFIDPLRWPLKFVKGSRHTAGGM